MNGYLCLKSIYPTGIKPEIFMFGHIYFLHNNGTEFIVEWYDSSTNCYIDSKGFVWFEINLKNIYEEFEDLNVDKLSVDILRNSKIVDISYDCYRDREEKNFEPLELVLLSIDCADGVFMTN